MTRVHIRPSLTLEAQMNTTHGKVSEKTQRRNIVVLRRSDLPESLKGTTILHVVLLMTGIQLARVRFKTDIRTKGKLEGYADIESEILAHPPLKRKRIPSIDDRLVEVRTTLKRIGLTDPPRSIHLSFADTVENIEVLAPLASSNDVERYCKLVGFDMKAVKVIWERHARLFFATLFEEQIGNESILLS